jgi:ankyrin repeat protein
VSKRLLTVALSAVWLISATAVFAADPVDANGSTPLLVAASNDDAALVKQLLKGGANPNVRNKLDTTPLLEAAFHSNTEIIKALLDAGADPNAAGADGQTPLMLVARGTNVAAAKVLLAKGANPRAKESQRQQTVLMWATANSQGPMTRLLVERGADLDAKTAIDLMTPLVSAELCRKPRRVRL